MLLALAVKIQGIAMIVLVLVLVWAVSFLFFKIVSLSSIIAAVSLPILLIIFHQKSILIVAGIVLSAFTIYRHKTNIRRLLQGRESKLRFNSYPRI